MTIYILVKFYNTGFLKIFRVFFIYRRLLRCDRLAFVTEDTNYAILIDQFALPENWTLDFLRARAEDPFCRLILLVSAPTSQIEWSIEHGDIAFDVIVRNSANKPYDQFKLHALDVIRSTSDYQIVAAIDISTNMRMYYEENDVAFVLDERGVLL